MLIVPVKSLHYQFEIEAEAPFNQGNDPAGVIPEHGRLRPGPQSVVVAPPVLDLATSNDTKLKISHVKLVGGPELAFNHARRTGESTPEYVDQLPSVGSGGQLVVTDLATQSGRRVVQLPLTRFQHAGLTQATLY